jgi:hypothetical protein
MINKIRKVFVNPAIAEEIISEEIENDRPFDMHEELKSLSNKVHDLNRRLDNLAYIYLHK